MILLMKLKICFSLFLLLLATIYVPAQTAAAQKEETIEVQVMLFDNLKELVLPPYCGIHMTDVVLKYKVIKVMHGFYLGNTIFIHQNCIREAIENKTLANHITYIYKLKLIAPAIEGKPGTYGIVM
ncbi:MAG: hypothetical protein JWP12_2712 [Bacteroidetes bacterium]|nr:hypothetical protein [Bacteroidota bacterium]